MSEYQSRSRRHSRAIAEGVVLLVLGFALIAVVVLAVVGAGDLLIGSSCA